MGRTSKIATTGLLVLALAAIAVPVGMNLAPALLPQHAAVVLAPPAAQNLPAGLATLGGIKALSPSAPIPNAAVLGTALDKALTVDGAGDFAALVTDSATGKVLYSRNASSGRTPASNLKLLTAVAALKSLGADTRFDTTVVAGASNHSIVLRAGGDSLLGEGDSDATATMGHAGLQTLADATAAALKKDGVTGPVTVGIDDSLFTGPALNPNWLSGDVDSGQITPVYPMALYGDRDVPGVETGPRPQDAAATVGDAFAAALQKAGVTVSGSVARADASSGARQLAAVSSATVAEQVDYALQQSDNYVAEVLGRMVGVKEKQGGSYTGAVAATESVLGRLGLDTTGLVMTDNCGLAPNNLVSASQLDAVVQLMLSGPNEDVRQGLAGLPIAGLSGTLSDRFTTGTTIGGAGVVRAKTGTLNTVATLSGYVINADGRLLTFSIMGNKFKDGSAAALPAIDAAAAVLAG